MRTIHAAICPRLTSSTWRAQRRVLGTIGIAIACMSFSSPQGPSSPPRQVVASSETAVAERPLAFNNVTIVDVTDGRLIPGQVVVVVGNRVQAVGPMATVRIPNGARVIDAANKYLIPGLWDMHAHVWSYPDVFYPLFIANGVTGIREMSQSPIDSMQQWRRQIIAGERVGPRIVGTGGFLNGSSFVKLPWGLETTTPEDARRVVDSLKAAGADFIKVRDFLSRDVYFEIVREARRVGLPVVGHLQSEVSAAEVSDSGQRSLEHIYGIHEVCSRGNSGGAVSPMFIVTPGEPVRDDDSVDVAKCTALAARLARNGTWITPTFNLAYHIFAPAGDEFGYWPASLRTEAPACCAGATPRTRGLMPIFGQVLGIMHHAGVPILAGTDAAPEGLQIVPGFSMPQELALLVEAGLTPLEALQAATLNPAKFLDATDSLGSVAPGKVADLVLLDADPLSDIHNTKTVRAVVANGRYYDRAALDSLFIAVKQGGR